MNHNKTRSMMQGFPFRLLTATLLLSLVGQTARADEWFDVWNNRDQWDVVGDAMVAASNPRELIGKPGQGVLLNGKTGRAKSLVSKQTFQDVEVHVEFMVPKGANSGVIFHGNHEIQILDSYGVKQPTAGDCGGIYPRAEGQPGTPSYHHLDGGSAPRVNAAKPSGEWQTVDIIFQAARFDRDGKKTSHAKFVKVVHNGQVIQENVEVPWACGPNWDRKQFPRGSVSLQGDYGAVAFRNVSVRPWKEETAAAGPGQLNVPPSGFTALFNGRDFIGWRVHPKVKEIWTIEDGVLRAPGLLEEWGADLVTEKVYRDFVLMLDFRMPTLSDSGIMFRRLIPEIPNFGDQEQCFTYPDWMMSLEPAPIRLQKHVFFDDDVLGKMNPCPIEFRNIFLKELEPPAAGAATKQGGTPGQQRERLNSVEAELLGRIDAQALPAGYDPQKHQDYVDRRMAGLSEAQRGRISQLWNEKQRMDPNMPNRGQSFVRIMEYVATHPN